MKTGKFIMRNGSELRIWQTSLGVNKRKSKATAGSPRRRTGHGERLKKTLQKENVMLVSARRTIGRISERTSAQEIIGEPRAIRSEHGQRAQGPLLQTAVGIKRIDQDAFMAFQHARTKIFRSAGLRLQLLELMEHFAPGGVERFDERGIEASERLFIFREHAAERRFTGFESAGETGRSEEHTSELQSLRH